MLMHNSKRFMAQKRKGWVLGLGITGGVLALAGLVLLIMYLVEANKPARHGGAYTLSAGHDIDLVITWVDSSDQAWIKDRDTVAASMGVTIDPKRFPSTATRTDAELQLVLESAHRFAPWIRQVFVVTAKGQVPPCAARFSKCTVVHHDAILPATALPTFNSHAIETALHRIPGLAHAFLYANDDMYTTNYTFPGDFFQGGKPVVWASVRWSLLPKDSNGHNRSWHNLAALDKDGVPWPFINRMAHVLTPLTKTLMNKVWEAYPKELLQVQHLPFRNNNQNKQYPPVGMAIVKGLQTGAVLRHRAGWGFTYKFLTGLEGAKHVQPYGNLCINDAPPDDFQDVRKLLVTAPVRTRPGCVIVIGCDGTQSDQLADVLLSQQVWWVANTHHAARVTAGLNSEPWADVRLFPTIAALEDGPSHATGVVGPASGRVRKQAALLAKRLRVPLWTFEDRTVTPAENDAAYAMAATRVVFCG